MKLAASMALLVAMTGAWGTEGAPEPPPGAEAMEVEEVFVRTGEHGEPSFSDVEEPGAERVRVLTAPPAEDPLAELERRITQTLAVAQALEASRLAREQARAEERAERRESVQVPERVVEERYLATHPYLFRPPLRHGHFPRRDRFPPKRDGRGERPDPEPEPEPRSRPFPWHDDDGER